MQNNLRRLAECGRLKKDAYKAWLVEGARFAGRYELPALEACRARPQRAIPFEKALKTTDRGQWIHFYLDDRRFECLWNNPSAYLARLKQFSGVLSPDFSLYRDMPLAMQLWNTYRNRALGYWMQANGIALVPNVQWGDARSYDFCFDGLPKNSTVAISTNGCIRDKSDRFFFAQGLAEMIDRLSPTTVVVYSGMPDDLFAPHKAAGIEFLHLPNWQDVVRGRCD